MSAECCQEVYNSLDTVMQLLGQLVLVREIQQRLLMSRLSDHTPRTDHTPTSAPSSRKNSQSAEGGLQWPQCEVRMI